ncbi:hypothetical protein ASG43_09820 [Aureimonas sp. Leaf454]|uniref:TadE/TadG family type IV pilus assembly protein n=1 Tax=Aureimonas sp. Leaf454 TaxID=1736381 RepID=UPI000713565B|nr:TadE/TadG family type IV pilus assembly protein [Aureimonas sp. Leaf454]KQT47409.1 hypothetical protein ASG43_09820 [Aureimonas sp. Leaf454]
MWRIQSHLKRFLQETRANIPILTAVMIVPMVLLAGGAIDMVRQEQIRIALQDALDRGVLAAASLKQTEEPRALIKSYLANVSQGSTAALTLKYEDKLNFRKVEASATIDYAPGFLKMAGVKKMPVEATSSAQEARSNIELSMVLDISGSMYDNGGINQLKPAAKAFLDIVLKEELRPVTSVNIVPFAGTVNLGYDAFNAISGFILQKDKTEAEAKSTGVCTHASNSPYTRRNHCYSSCFEMNASDFQEGIPNFKTLDQAPHFSVYNISAAGKKPWWCPVDAAAVTYMTNDLDLLKKKIDALDPYDGTGTAYGMKWAELLLNPGMRKPIAAVAAAGAAKIPAGMTNRPADFDDADTQKFIVLMTDGQIGFQPRPKAPSDLYVNTKQNITGNIQKVVYSEGESASFYKKVCDYSKKEGIIIFTIAFKVSTAVAKTIAECASDPSFAYKVDGLDMASAFESIATSMQKIRLVR